MTLARRDFLKAAGGLGILSRTGHLLSNRAGHVAILADPADSKAASAPALWAASELREALQSRNIAARMAKSLDECRDARLRIVAASDPSGFFGHFSGAGAFATGQRESFHIEANNTAADLLVRASDSAGFVYGLSELADRARYGDEPISAMASAAPLQGRPANAVRSITRAFVSEVEDKPWYYDKTFWRDYLSVLAAQRFNRFNLAFGIGWDFAREITDDYFHFAYPFLVDVPGYNVRVTPLSAQERDRNLAMLQFVSEETEARGIEFHLGLWTHAYEWHDSPRAAHRVEGLTAQTQAPYCRDALALLLKHCPAIRGLTFRVHGESGVAEGSYDFWRTLFSAIPASGRVVSIDLHAKGLDERMIEVALATGMPVSVSPKFWAEHMGLGYHQTAIRGLEMPPRTSPTRGLFSLSEGSRKFMRYGYGDLFRRGRKYQVIFRLWPGTQRHLLWGDPAMAAAYGRSAGFCGASGMEICEPLFFKGRKGSGLPGGRCAYQDASLEPHGDFRKYLYSYRVWGRMLYDPHAAPEDSARYLRAGFGSGARPVEETLAHASRILPLITTAHLPSAANNTYWPEMYTNMPVVEGSSPQIYGDTPRPKRFGTVSPIDPGIFSTVEECVSELLEGTPSGKYSPVEVAQWLEDLAARAEAGLKASRAAVARHSDPEFRRFTADAMIQAGIGRFFAAKFRAAGLFAIWQKTAEREALERAIASYRKSRDAWSAFASQARPIYRADVTYGPDPNQRGHWEDRLPAIDKDLAAMEALLNQQSPAAATAEADARRSKSAIRAWLGRPERPVMACSHTPAKSFRAGEPLPISLGIRGAAAGTSIAVTLHYRHVNQAEDWQTLATERQGETYDATIAAAYTESPFALQYYFALRRGANEAWLYPALGGDLTQQPYYVVPQA